MSDEYNAIRYAAQIQSEHDYKRINGYRSQLEICKRLGWSIYYEELITNAKNDTAVNLSLAFMLQPDLTLRKSSFILDSIDNYFTNLNPKNIQSELLKIKEYLKKYYDLGNFSHYISVFNRFVVPLKNDIQETELHSFIYKYVISSSIKKQYDLAISEISKLKQHYLNYDVSVYIL